ncbi:MAG: PIN domain-containing protein [Candidatus Bipolaricaulota bacterium]
MLFIDTWGWIVLYNRREPRHSELRALYRELSEDERTAYTTDYVLDETITLLFRRVPVSQACRALQLLNKAVQEGYLCLEYITPERFSRAKDLRVTLQDKPQISFTDLTTMVVMEELRLKRILTQDQHFAQVGMGFNLVP